MSPHGPTDFGAFLPARTTAGPSAGRRDTVPLLRSVSEWTALCQKCTSSALPLDPGDGATCSGQRGPNIIPFANRGVAKPPSTP